MERFVALMRRYCIDYTNSHNQSICDEIMHPDYVVHIAGMVLPRDAAYKPAVRQVFDRFPGLELEVHEFVTNGDRLAMRFSEHGASPAADGRFAPSPIEVHSVEINDLFSAGNRVAFHLNQKGTYTGGIPRAAESLRGAETTLCCVGFVRVVDGTVTEARVITDRLGARAEVLAAVPGAVKGAE